LQTDAALTTVPAAAATGTLGSVPVDDFLLTARSVTVSSGNTTTTVTRAFSSSTGITAEISRTGTATPSVRFTRRGLPLADTDADTVTLYETDAFGHTVSQSVYVYSATASNLLWHLTVV
jgi:hypothetical protein